MKDELLTIWKAKKKAALHFRLQSKSKADPKTESMAVKPQFHLPTVLGKWFVGNENCRLPTRLDTTSFLIRPTFKAHTSYILGYRETQPLGGYSVEALC